MISSINNIIWRVYHGYYDDYTRGKVYDIPSCVHFLHNCSQYYYLNQQERTKIVFAKVITVVLVNIFSNSEILELRREKEVTFNVSNFITKLFDTYHNHLNAVEKDIFFEFLKESFDNDLTIQLNMHDFVNKVLKGTENRLNVSPSGFMCVV